MFIKENIKKTKSIISRIEETIIPLQEKKLWNDDEFFEDVNNFLTNEIINEDKITSIVANALFRLARTQPEVEVVKTLIKAFPMALKCTNHKGKMPIQYVGAYRDPDDPKHWTHQYILPLALEGSKHDVGGEGMGGGLRCGHANALQQLCYVGNERSLKTLKDLRDHNLFVKSDIETEALLGLSCLGPSSSVLEYLVQWHPEALRSTSFDCIIDRDQEGIKFVKFLSTSMKYYKDILFEKDKPDGQTAFERAFNKYGEEKTMHLLREVITEEAGYPLLHEVIVHQQDYYNLFLHYFPFLYRTHLRDDKGRTITQVMLSSNLSFLKANPERWINLRSDQLEEKDPVTSLRPFAAAAVGDEDDYDLNLSYQILRQHPSVIDVILEQREKEKEKKDSKRQKRKQENAATRMADVQKKLKFSTTLDTINDEILDALLTPSLACLEVLKKCQAIITSEEYTGNGLETDEESVAISISKDVHDTNYEPTLNLEDLLSSACDYSDEDSFLSDDESDNDDEEFVKKFDCLETDETQTIL